MTNKEAQLNDCFTFKQLEDFFKKYPIHDHIAGSHRVHYHDIGTYIIAFKHYINTGEDVMPDYFKISNVLYSLRDYLSYVKDNYQDIDTDVLKDEIEYLLNYNWYWDIDSFLNKLRITKEFLIRELLEINNGFRKHNKIQEIKEQNELDEYIRRYYNKSKAPRDEIRNCLYSIEKESLISKDIIDLRNIKYPIILLLYLNNQVVSIHKVTHSLERAMANYKSKKSFEFYRYKYFNEEIINDVFAEGIVNYNPVNISTKAITLSNTIYRTLNHVKKRYKNEIDLRKIKKVIDKYNLPLYNLKNGSQVVDKDLFDNALRLYYKR
ncbi:hypothetical protein F8154_08835 [Alkaliphilus pronyensis]|uniref:Uncharacterized protein n=1 Tax=Alkaliphilus pronyensis TaxID=1482732 RepID=A0A6I0F810_9FIRM|nr:hypothetical protein [Alkaliphilus pronyensis]KAB3534505.1 hypothetical protein F8154_08835 [Alkaliphilus pronyensis]